MLSPCENCSCRFVGCHIQCPQYKAYTEDNTAIRERDTQRRHLEYELYATGDKRRKKEDEQMTDKIILDATCGTRSIWFNKNHPAAVYMDKRIVVNEKIWESKDKSEKRYMNIQPDVLGDFTEIPYESNHFSLVIFDPPHIKRAGETAWIVKKYGKLNENWPQMLHDGFKECMRVLKPEGVLIFKWSEVQIPAKEVWKALGCKPLFGHHSGKKSLTYWGVFMKGIDSK